MDDWIQIISNQWNRMISNHNITWVCCELKNYRKFIMWYCVIIINFSISTSYWIILARVLKNVIDTTNISLTVVLLYSFLYTSKYLPHGQKIILMRVNNKTVFILHGSFVFLFFLIHIFQISQISTTRTNIWAQHLKIYVTTCFHTQSRIIICMFLGYVLGLFYYYYYCMCQFST